MSNSIPICVQYKVTKTEKDSGEVLYEETSKNLVVKLGREYVLRNLFDLTPTTFLAMGVGVSSTDATVNDTRLTYELIGNATRVTLTNTSGAPLSSSDIQNGTFSVDGGTYYKKLPVQVIYDGTTDGNVGAFFAEYAIFDTDVLPVTPTSTSGIMFNHYVPNSSIELGPTTIITVIANIYV